MSRVSHIWSGMAVRAETQCKNGQMEVTIRETQHDGWTGYALELQGNGSVSKLLFSVEDEGWRQVDGIFLTCPNYEDVKMAHRSQTVNLGIADTHPDYRFGRQWFFTPPPLVFPVHVGGAWYGVALGAQPGKNQFSSVSYRPDGEGRYRLEVFYDGYYSDEGPLCSVFYSTEPQETPYAVIAAYAELLRRLGWAPAPSRTPADWWKEPFLCTWGDQVNLANVSASKPNKEKHSHHVTTYETQGNQERWLRTLLDRGIPVGVVCTSDKWQADRYRLLPDEGRYPDMRAFTDWHHREGRHVMAWWGVWNCEGAPEEWCIRDGSGKPVSVDPDHPEYRRMLIEDIKRVISPDGYNFDGFFIDFTNLSPMGAGLTKTGRNWGIELLHDYMKLIYDTVKSVKPDAMVMTHCNHPYFADVTDVLRLNDFVSKVPNVVEQGMYRAGIARAVSDWLVNMDNWWMHDIDDWRRYLVFAAQHGIPSSWFTQGVWGHGPGIGRFDPFTEEDYRIWREVWTEYRERAGLVPMAAES